MDVGKPTTQLHQQAKYKPRVLSGMTLNYANECGEGAGTQTNNDYINSYGNIYLTIHTEGL